MNSKYGLPVAENDRWGVCLKSIRILNDHLVNNSQFCSRSLKRNNLILYVKDMKSNIYIISDLFKEINLKKFRVNWEIIVSGSL